MHLVSKINDLHRLLRSYDVRSAMNQPTKINQSVNQSTNQPVIQSVSQSNSQSVSQSIN